MLRVTMMPSGEAATRYYTAPIDDCEIVVKEPGIWGGKGAVLLGLAGEVSRTTFRELASNNRPGMTGRLTVRTKEYRRSGYDFSFSVPKSLSIYMAETGDKRMERLIKEACKEAMAEIEQCMETRVRKNGADHNRVTGNIVYAAFAHRTARPVNNHLDPQFHLHCYVFNATFDREENRWKAGEFGEIKCGAPAHQKAFLDRVESKLRANGYRLRKTLKGFEIASISRDLIEKFSKRSQIIKEAAKARREAIEKRAVAFSKKAQIKIEKAMAAIKGGLGKLTRERKSRKKLNPIEQLLSWRKQMTSEERYSVRKAMPITPDRAPKNIQSMLGHSKRVDREQGRER